MRPAAAVFCLALAPLVAAQNVTYERLVHALDEQQNWLTYWGDYSAVRHRDLKQISTTNVKELRLDWIFQTGQAGSFETVPLVVDRVMYLTASNGDAAAHCDQRQSDRRHLGS